MEKPLSARMVSRDRLHSGFGSTRPMPSPVESGRLIVRAVLKPGAWFPDWPSARRRCLAATAISGFISRPLDGDTRGSASADHRRQRRRSKTQIRDLKYRSMGLNHASPRPLRRQRRLARASPGRWLTTWSSWLDVAASVSVSRIVTTKTLRMAVLLPYSREHRTFLTARKASPPSTLQSAAGAAPWRSQGQQLALARFARSLPLPS